MDFRRKRRFLWRIVLGVSVYFTVAGFMAMSLQYAFDWNCAENAACVAALNWLPVIKSSSRIVGDPAWVEWWWQIKLFSTFVALLSPLCLFGLALAVVTFVISLLSGNRSLVAIAAAAGIVSSLTIECYWSEIERLLYVGAFQVSNFLRLSFRIVALYFGALSSALAFLTVVAARYK